MRRINSLLGAAFHGWAAPRGFTTVFLCILIVIGGAIITSDVFSKGPGLGVLMSMLEKDKKARSTTGTAPARALGLRGQTSSSVKPRQSPNPCVWRRRHDLGLPPLLVAVVAVAEVAQVA